MRPTPSPRIRLSGSPSPCRSPSPDIITKTSIAHTRHLSDIPIASQKLSIGNDEVVNLRSENNKLREIIAGGGKGNQAQQFNQLLKEKDRVIGELKQRVKELDGKGREGSLLEGSRRREEQGKVIEQVEIIKKLRERILQLEVDNQNFKKRKPSSIIETPKHKPVRMDDPIPFSSPLSQSQSQSQISLSESQVQQLKTQLVSQLNLNLTAYSQKFVLKLQQLESRLKLIDNKLDVSTVSRSGDKYNYGVTTAVGNITTTVGGYPDELTILNQRVYQLESQVIQGRSSEAVLKRKNQQLEMDLESKNRDILYLKQQLDRKPKSQEGFNDDYLEKNRLVQQNTTIKQSLTRLTNEVINHKNNEVNYKKDNWRLTQQLQVQKIRNFNTHLSLPIADHADHDYKIRQLTLSNQMLENDIRSLKDTLQTVRHSLQQNQTNNYSLQRTNENLKLQNSNLDRQVKSLIDQRHITEREIISLKMQISALQGINKNNSQMNVQMQDYKYELLQSQEVIRGLQKKVLELESDKANLQGQLDRALFENESLKRTAYANNEENINLIQSSDHTKQTINRLNQEKTNLQFQVSRLNAQLNNNQTSLTYMKERMSMIQGEKMKRDSENRSLKQELNQLQFSLNLSKSQLQRFLHSNKFLTQKNFQLETDLNRYKLDNDRQLLISEIQTLKTKLFQSEMNSFNFRTLEQQRNNELQSALAQLAEVKAILSKINFQGVENFIKQLKSRDHQMSEYEYSMDNKHQEENERLQRDNLNWINKYMEEKQKVEQMGNQLSFAQETNRGLLQKISGLQTLISQFRSQHLSTPIKQQEKFNEGNLDTKSSNGTEFEVSVREIDSLREPVHEAVMKLDKIAEKIQSKIGSRRLRGSGVQVGQK